MLAGNTISGPGYSVQLPPGFTLAQGVPVAGVYRLLPPGVSPFDIEALLQIRPVQAFELPALLQNVYAFENPAVAQFNAQNLGMAGVLGILPVRQVQMPQGLTHIREFDAVNFAGVPVRVMVLVMIGAQSAVEVVVVMNLYRWAEFVAPCLDFVGRISLGGVPQAAPQLLAVVDQKRQDQIEYQLVGPNQAPIPLTALPTNVGGTTIIHVDTLIQTGDINGTGIAVGTHSTAVVKPEKATITPS
jgi:hypothetical protein